MRSKGKDGERAEHLYALPKLRFPGFQERWEESTMSQLYSFKGNNSLSRDKLNYEGGSLRNIHYGDIHTKFAPLFRVDEEQVPYINDGETHSAAKPENYCAVGDMVFADASEDTDDIGKAIEIMETGDVPLVAGLHTILARPAAGKVAVGFGAYLFASNGVRSQIQREAQGAKVLGLSAVRLGAIRLSYPCDQKEQKRIVECLSFFDACISAETLKLDALKAHKQGLMQQLFPAEGERQPDLRFPEFDGNWDTVALGDVSAVVRGGSPRPIDSYITHAADGLNWLKIGDVDKAAKYIERTEQKVMEAALGKTRQVRPGDLILSNSMSFGRPYISKITCCIHDGWLAITQISKQITSDFLYYALGSSASQTYFLNAAAGSGVKNLNADIIKQLSIAVPALEEQKKISDCLSEIDDVIAIQSRMIALFQQHKAGLMQGLFPRMEALAP